MSDIKNPVAGSAAPDDAIAVVAADAVRQDLGVTDDVSAYIDRQVDEFSTTFRKLAASRMPREEADRELAEAKTAATQNIRNRLTSNQSERLQQIRWQILGAAALAERELADKLDLTESQRATLQELVKSKVAASGAGPSARPATLGPSTTADDNAPQATQRLQQYPSWSQSRLLDALSDEQVETLEQMLGRPFR